MGSRFSNLEDVYNNLVAINFDFNTLPATNKYRNYAEWKQNPDKRKLPAGSAQDTGARKRAGVKPFGLALDPQNQYDVGMSGRAFGLLTDLGGTALYGLETAALDDYSKRPGFRPAKAVLAVKRATSLAVPATDNRITGQPYKRRTGETYTVPFGRTTGNAFEFGAQEAILTAKSGTHAVTFIPEKLSRK